MIYILKKHISVCTTSLIVHGCVQNGLDQRSGLFVLSLCLLEYLSGYTLLALHEKGPPALLLFPPLS